MKYCLLAFCLAALDSAGGANAVQPVFAPTLDPTVETQPDFRSVTFELTRNGLPVPHWIIELHADGSGTYKGSQSASGSDESHAIRVTPAEQQKFQSVLPVVQTGRCETKIKNIANTGRKIISFHAADGAIATCIFNFSDNEPLNVAASAFIAIAETMQAGERLAQKHRYDRLGLDAEMDVLVEEVKGGRATDVMNIAPVLQSIAEDERLMERVQRKAARLLQDADAAPAAESAR